MEQIIEKIRFLKSKGNLSKAKELSLEAIKDAPNNSLLLYEIGDILRLQKNYKESTYFFKKSIDADSSKLSLLNNEKSFEKLIFHDLRHCHLKLHSDLFYLKERISFDRFSRAEREKIFQIISSANDEVRKAEDLIDLADYRERSNR